MKYIILILIQFIFYLSLFSQEAFVPVTNDVYSFLEKLYVKGAIDYNDILKPLSRKYIAEKLNQAGKRNSVLSDIEKKELEFYTKEYFYELKLINNEKIIPYLNYISFGQEDRFRFLSYYDSTFSIFGDPVLGYDLTDRKSEDLLYRKNGVRIYGNLSSLLSFSINFLDNMETGNFIDMSRQFSPKTGFSFDFKEGKKFNYDDVCAALTFSWKWGNISLEKDYLRWGNGKQGQIILSDKAPSFPMIQINASPVNWLNFTYILGYLNSGVVDSSTIRVNINKERKHYSLIEKYIAAHLLTLKPLSTLSLSLGESVIFSDRFEPIYLIPFIPFRVADHYLNFVNETAGNAQIFLDMSWVVPFIKSKLYGTLFIDEYSVSNVLDNTNLPSAIAYTVGGLFTDPFISDLSYNLEYTRINPFVYFHSDDAQAYTNYKYQMGHWIGSNGDQLYFSLNKTILRGFNLSAYWEHIRKGQKESQTEKRYQSWQTFLYGLRTNYTYFGIDLKYEIIHSLFAKINYRFSSIDHEQQDHTFINEKYNDLSCGLSYGF